MKSKAFVCAEIALLVLLGVSSELGRAQGVVDSTDNPMQVATLHWYGANQTTQFSVGSFPCGVAFDGANIWVANLGGNNVTKLRANDGANLGTFAAGSGPYALAYDGANLWATDAPVTQSRSCEAEMEPH